LCFESFGPTGPAIGAIFKPFGFRFTKVDALACCQAMTIRLRNGFNGVRTGPVDEDGNFLSRHERMVAVNHPDGGGYIYTRFPKEISLEFLKVPPQKRGVGRARELLDHCVAHLDHRRLRSKLELAPLERGITNAGLRRLYASRGWQGDGKVMVREAKSKAP
jgi:hypothetical protein